MVNSNPETVSTDYDTSDKLFFEPLTLEDVLHIYEREKMLGRNRAIRWANAVESRALFAKKTASTSSARRRRALRLRDRKLFAAMLDKLKIPQPPNGLATNAEEALVISKRLTYPVLVASSFFSRSRDADCLF